MTGDQKFRRPEDQKLTEPLLIGRETPRAPFSLGVLDAQTGKPIKVFAEFNPASGGDAERVTNFSDLAVLRFALSPDARTLLLCRGTMTRDAFLISNFN